MSSGKPDHLTSAGLEWALLHVTTHRDTDLFPAAFEFTAIKSRWATYKAGLERIDLQDYTPETPYTILAPKPGTGYRIATRLSPRDSLLYAAMVYEVAPLVEKHRVSAAQRIACSFRVDVQPDGRLFRDEDGAKDFHECSKRHVESGQHPFTLATDISDFYTHINIHRIQNGLEQAGIDLARSNSVERFLMGLNTKDSRGIPIGPYVSNLLAELCLDDVDKRFLSNGTTYTRYVDDFRIFCNSRVEADGILRGLIEYLHSTHRLNVQGAKTRVIPSDKLFDVEGGDPELQEDQSKRQKVQEYIESLRGGGDYGFSHREPREDEIKSLNLETIEEMFTSCITRMPTAYSLARYLLRRASLLRTRTLLKSIQSNFNLLAPVIRDVCQYLNAVVPANPNDGVKCQTDELIQCILASEIIHIPFVKLWVIDLLSKRPNMASQQVAFKLAKQAEPELGVRPAALLAVAYADVSWVRSFRDRWGTLQPWDKRAVIYATQLLPRAERGKWLDVVREAGDSLDECVATLASAQ